MMSITDVAKLQSLSVEYLIGHCGYDAVYDETITVVFSSPNRIQYGSGEFMGRFLFDNNWLTKVTLNPIIPGVKGPNYPSKEYQETKYAWCTALLRNLYGPETKSTDQSTTWEIGEITIWCYITLDKRESYTGGKIVIDFPEAN